VVEFLMTLLGFVGNLYEGLSSSICTIKNDFQN